MPNCCATPMGGTVSPLFPNHCLEEFLMCLQFAVLGVQNVTSAPWSFGASWRKSVQKILNDFKILSSNDNGQWVNGGLLRDEVEVKRFLWDSLTG